MYISMLIVFHKVTASDWQHIQIKQLTDKGKQIQILKYYLSKSTSSCSYLSALLLALTPYPSTGCKRYSTG